VDGVVANLMEGWLRLYNQDHGTTLDTRDITQWDIHKIPKIAEQGVKIYDYLHRADLYDSVQPINGAQEGVQGLRELGHRVVFVTTNVKGMTDPKWTWLEMWGFLPKGRHNQDDLAVVADKLLIDTAIHIDDKPATIEDWVEKKHRRGILFEQPWNSHALDHKHSNFWMWVQRESTWPGIVSYIGRAYHDH